MKREQLILALFAFISAVFFFLFYKIIVPFFVPLCWAAVFAVVFYPWFERIVGRSRYRGVTAFLMTMLIVVLIIVPVSYIFLLLIKQIGDALQRLNEAQASGELDRLLRYEPTWLTDIKTRLAPYIDLSRFNISGLVRDTIEKVSGFVVTQTGWIISNTSKAVFYFFVMIFSLYYFFKDGHKLVEIIRRLLPLSDSQTEDVINQLRDVTYATMYSGVFIAALQGVAGGLLFWAVGIPSSLFWGALMGFLSIIPFLGGFVVYIPAGIYLIIIGETIKGVIVLIIGSVLVSQIDNVLRPLMVAGRTSMHPLLLFLGMTGGIGLFGLLGVVVGPIIVAAFATLINIIQLRVNPAPVVTTPDGKLNDGT